MHRATLALLIVLLAVCHVAETSADVTEEWVARFDGPDSYFDDAIAIAVDDSGFVYVTGTAVRASSTDFATLKYAPNGQQRWVAYFDGLAGGSEEARDLALDGQGNVYVVGVSEAAPYDDEFVTVKYNWAGHEEWVSRFNGARGDYDGGNAVAVDDSGYIYVTGYGSVGTSGQNWTTIRYDADGDSLWVSRYNGPYDHDDWSSDIAVDDSGHVYVTGASRGIGTSRDCCTIKYGPSGNEIWVSTYDGPAHSNDMMEAITLNDSGGIYATGYSNGVGCEYDYVTIKYGPGGRSRWVARYDGPANDWDWAQAICVDDSGNVYVTGYSDGGATGNDCVTIKYGPSGNETWVARYDGPDSGTDAAYSIALDADRNVYAAGRCENVGTASYDYLAIQYNPGGDEQWVQIYTGPCNSGWDIAWAMAVDDTANVYLTGTSRGETTYDDYLTIKYSPEVPVEGSFYAVLGESGVVTLRWTVGSLAGIDGFNLYRGTSPTGPFMRLNEDTLPPASPGCFDDGTVWPETTFWYELRALLGDGSEDVVKPSPISVMTRGRLAARLYPARPNPFRGETILWFDVPSHVGPVSLAIYNVGGRQVASLVDGPLDRGRQCVRWDGTTPCGLPASSGVYFARLEVEGRTKTEKLVLVR